MGERLVIPKGLRKNILTELHTGHTGVDRSLRRARETVYWPGMTNDLRDFTQRCETCCESQGKELLMSHEILTHTWQKVGADLLTHNGKDYLITVDYYSNCWEIDRLYDTLSKFVINRMKAPFARYGTPEQLVTDNGLQFSSAKILQQNGTYNILLALLITHSRTVRLNLL